MSNTIPVKLVFSDGQTNTLQLEEGTSILTGARDRGLSLLVDCEQGNCGTCQAQVSHGMLEMEEFSPYVLSEAECANGVVLVCRAKATQPATIELPYCADDALAASDAGCAAVVERIEPVAEDTIALTLVTEGAVSFLPGQYVNITVPDGSFERSFSMANPPGSQRLEFYVALRPDGRFSHWLTSEARAGESVSLSAPRGTFYLRGDARPKVMVAGGTGLAPFLSMLAQLAQEERPEIRSAALTLFVGARHERQLFEIERIEQFKDRLPGLQIHVSCDEISPGSSHRRGRVTQLLEALSIDQSSSIYVCGPPPMVDAVRAILKDKQIPARQLYAEKFIG
ncbi:2Fe-2S iron-sulfur cluster binding domain-containing protein [Paraburkholderia phenoliruptrix]|uniref:2Fe-2S iron-sulfur cluster binding domain-containing protein n=1 Tax=Paraburkholderia phenoliruptrix TaxID=252970 RepID=UPI001C6EDA76|nr:2Fe-2S iron-sulfur cluster binding domain-containing protein [Paraburkholderia phenoliruptrix]MBW9107438.1 2Fe-2S iron-sulfur cluster binding domain-containing protein [Paraburkholderia phenoliruptrix]MBW9128140.1 2Fe-2S iron-sulfur cluster binding domain-containing protein [Paraburkholderia ginsengiterrae]